MCCGLVAALVAALSGVLVGEPQDASEGITQLKELSHPMPFDPFQKGVRPYEPHLNLGVHAQAAKPGSPVQQSPAAQSQPPPAPPVHASHPIPFNPFSSHMGHGGTHPMPFIPHQVKSETRGTRRKPPAPKQVSPNGNSLKGRTIAAATTKRALRKASAKASGLVSSMVKAVASKPQNSPTAPAKPSPVHQPKLSPTHDAKPDDPKRNNRAHGRVKPFDPFAPDAFRPVHALGAETMTPLPFKTAKNQIQHVHVQPIETVAPTPTPSYNELSMADKGIKFYNTTKSHHYDPSKSFTSETVGGADSMFDLKYADGTIMRAFPCRDVVQLGKFHTHTRFACSVLTNNMDMDGIDGILGFGMPAASVASLPHPLLFDLTDSGRGADTANNHIMHNRIFSFLSTETAGELQLGGYDPSSVDGDLLFTPSVATTEYAVRLTSFKLGTNELLHFTPLYDSAPGLLDSGTACLVLPDAVGDRFRLSPWQQFLKHRPNQEPEPSIFITVESTTFEIPYHVWYLNASATECVHKSPQSSGFAGIILGDVLFRRLLVVFDLTDSKKPVIGLATQNKDYRPVSQASQRDINSLVKKMPAMKVLNKRQIELKVARDRADKVDLEKNGGTELDRIPLLNIADTLYYIGLEIGTPRQKFIMLFDTGSSMLAVFAKPPTNGHSGSIFRVLHQFKMGTAYLQTKFGIESLDAPYLATIALLAVVALVLLAGVAVQLRRRLQRARSGRKTTSGSLLHDVSDEDYGAVI